MRRDWHVTTPCCGLNLNDVLVVSSSGIRVTGPGTPYYWSSLAIANMAASKVPAKNGLLDYTAVDDGASPGGKLTCTLDGIIGASWVAEEGPPPPIPPPGKPPKVRKPRAL